MRAKRVDLETAKKCASGDATYNHERGGYDCNGCGRHFAMRSINVHTYAARRRVEHASAVVRP